MPKIDAVRDTLHLLSQWIKLEWSCLFKSHRKSADGKHIALFAWALPPNSNAGVYRPLSFIQYGSTLGWRFDTFQGLAPKNQSEHGEELLERVPKDVRSHVVNRSSRRPSYRFSPQIDGGFKNALALAEYAIDQLSSDAPSVVLASGPPFHVFVSAYFVAKWFGVPLVLDYRDEWTECPFDFVDKSAHDRYWERRCLAGADAVLFTTQSHIEHQIKCFPELRRERTHLIPNGWEPNDFIAQNCQVRIIDSTTRVINLAHIGNLAGHTPPHSFLKALDELLTSDPMWRERLVVHFIGRRSPEAASALERFPFKANLRIVDHVGKQEANRRMQEADCLLLIAVPELERYMPGKLFDYVAAGRPILVFGSSGEASSIVDSLGIGRLCSIGSSSMLADSLQRLSGMALIDQTASVQQWLKDHQRRKLAESAFQILSSLTRPA